MIFSIKYKIVVCNCDPFAAFCRLCSQKPANSGNAQEGRKKVVGFAEMSNDNPWWIAETKSMRDEAAKRGYEIVVTDAQGQMSKQVSDVEDLIARRVDRSFYPPQQFEGIAPALAAAKAAKIPVVLLYREAAGTAGQDYVTFIVLELCRGGPRARESGGEEIQREGRCRDPEGTAVLRSPATAIKVSWMRSRTARYQDPRFFLAAG